MRLLIAVWLLVVLGLFPMYAAPHAPDGPTAVFRRNLLVNPDAELMTGWANETGTLSIVGYGSSAQFPTFASPGPLNRGSNFFAGGDNDKVITGQDLDLTPYAALIDSGNVRLVASGWFGGTATEADQAYLEVNLRDGSQGFLDQILTGFVIPADRQNITGLLSRGGMIAVPVGTRELQVRLQMDRFTGSYNDGYADNLAVSLRSVFEVYVPLIRR